MGLDVENLTVSDLAQLLVAASDKESEDFNTLYDELELSNSENLFLKMQISTLESKLESTLEDLSKMTERFKVLESQSGQVMSNGEKHLTVAKQACREKEQLQGKYDTLKEQMAPYKLLGSPKKIREKIKEYQTKQASNLLAIGKAKELIKEYRKEIDGHINVNRSLKANEVQESMTSIWSENGDNLMLFPAKLSMQIGDHVERQITLLYMTKSGCGKLIGLDEDGLPAVCKMPKGGMKPKAKTLEVAGEMLRKWRRQDWKLTVEDLDLGSKK
tara:strand:- start:12780 stop:13598 length:819 start_codon:yes stop_codon:yes gene_type:complete